MKDKYLSQIKYYYCEIFHSIVHVIWKHKPEETNWGTLQYAERDLMQLVTEVRHQL